MAQRPPLRVYFLLFFTCLTAYALVFDGTNWNSITRFAATMSIVRFGTVTIDHFVGTTGDKARSGGHFVSDKAPGMSLLALPATYVAANAFSSVDTSPLPADSGGNLAQRASPGFLFLEWIATIATSGLLTALAAVAFLDAAMRLGVPSGTALAFSLLGALGTPLWVWSTVLFGHAAAGALLLLAFWAIVRIEATDQKPGRLALAGLAGFLLASAVVTEFPAALAALFIGLYALWRIFHRRVPNPWTVVAMAIVGGASPMLALAIYNEAAFGAPFRIGYGSVVGFEGMQTGMFGVSTPSLAVLFEITFGGLRGIVWFMPIILLYPWALVVLARQKFDLTALSAAVVLSFFLINAGYFYWDGGWSTGPRHVVPSLWFVVLVLALACPAMGKPGKYALWPLAILGVVVSFISVTSDMFTPDHISGVSLFTWIVPKFLAGAFGTIVFQPLVPFPFVPAILYAAVVAAFAAATWLALPRASAFTGTPTPGTT